MVFRTSVGVAHGLRAYKGAAPAANKRTQIVNRLAANSRCAFTRAELEAMPEDMLVKLDASMGLATVSGLRPYKGAAA